MPGAIVTLLFTSLASSTELLDRLGDIAFGELRTIHLRLLRTALADRHGEEVKNLGDGLMVMFPSAVDALGAAIDMQEAVERHNRSAVEPIAVRIGLHVGEPIAEEADYFGSPVVIARRLCDSAEPGQILASSLVRDLVGRRGSFEFTDLGARVLKGFADPLSVCDVAWRRPPVPDVAAPHSLPTALVRPGDETFVNRGFELDQLSTLWADVAAGARRAVLIAGEPGIGKTRLAGELATLALNEGGRVLYGRCDEEPPLPYQPFVEALRDLIDGPGAPTLQGTGITQLSRLMPELAGGSMETGASQAEPGADRYAFFEAVVDLFAAESTRHRVVLVLDDLHWAPKPTVLLLRHLLRHSAPMSLLLVGTYRDTELERGHPLAELLADLRRDPSIERITLAGLDEPAVAEFVAARAGADASAAQLGRTLHAETGGNPFFMREVLSHLLEHPLSGRAPRSAVRAVGLPESVRDVILRRFEQLTPDAQRVLQIGAVIGASFDVSVLESVPDLGLDGDAVLDALDESVLAGVLAEDGWTYRFSHELVRQTVYEQMLVARRAQLHGRVAQAIESSPRRGGQVSELAHHYALATRVRPDNASKAIEYARRAGRDAMSQLAFEQAAEYFDRALVTLDSHPALQELQRAELLLDAAAAARATGEPQRSMELAQQTAEIATRAADHQLLARAALQFEEAMWLGQGFMDEAAIQPAFTLLTRALDAIGRDLTPLRVALLTRLPRVLYFTAPTEDKLRYADEAVAQAAQLGNPTIQAGASEARRWALWGTGDLDAQLTVSNDMLRHAEAANDPQLQVRAHVWRYLASLDLGDLAGVDAAVADLDRLGRLIRDPLALWYPTAARTMRALLEGRLEQAESYALEGFVAADKADLDWAVTSFGIQIYFVRREQGTVAELEEPTRRLPERLPSIAAVRCALADLYCQIGKLDDARHEFEVFAQSGFDIQRDFGWILCIGLLADVCGVLGDVERAATLYELLTPHADRNLVVAPGIASLGSTSRNLGVLSTTLGAWEDAERHFAAAMDFNTRLGAAPWVARTALDWARMLTRRGGPGDGDGVGRLVAQAGEIADERGLRNIRDLATSFSAGDTI